MQSRGLSRMSYVVKYLVLRKRNDDMKRLELYQPTLSRNVEGHTVTLVSELKMAELLGADKAKRLEDSGRFWVVDMSGNAYIATDK